MIILKMAEYTIVRCEYCVSNDGYYYVDATFNICLNDKELQTFEKLYSNKYFCNVESYSCSSKNKIPTDVVDFINNNKLSQDAFIGIKANINL